MLDNSIVAYDLRQRYNQHTTDSPSKMVYLQGGRSRSLDCAVPDLVRFPPPLFSLI